MKNCKAVLSSDDATALSTLFEQVQDGIINHPFTDETEQLKSKFVEFLKKQGVLQNSVSDAEVLHVLQSSCMYQVKQHTLITEMLPYFNVSSQKGSSFFCSIASGGTGKTTPIVIGPMPHAIVWWKGMEGQEYTVTTVGGIKSGKGFIAYGNQHGMALGFEGIGLTYGTPFGTVYGLTGYAFYTSVTADDIAFYPPNNKPTVSNPIPSNNQQNVPITLSELSFHLQDDDNELMDYSVTTDPFIGAERKNNVGNVIHKISVAGLHPSTTYHWTVTVTDGKETTENTFSFTTMKEQPIVSNPKPPDGSSTTIDLSELRVTLTDAQGDQMEYTIHTSPHIGSTSATGIGNGTYTLRVSDLEENMWYFWYVNVTDGAHETNERFSFYTGGVGLVGHWDFNEGTGDIAHDTSEYLNDATVYGPTWTSESVSGYALDFDGMNDYTLVDNSPSLNFHDTNEFTISLWFKSKGSLSSYDECLISKATTANMAGYCIEIDSSNKTLFFDMYNGNKANTLYSKTAIEDNTWYHLVTVWDGTKQCMYLNGLLENEKYDDEFSISDDSKPLEFGHHYGYTNGKAAFHGIIDEIQIYEGAMNERDIMNLFQQKISS